MPPIVVAVVAAVAAYAGAAGAVALAATIGVTIAMTSMTALVAAAVVGSIAAMAAGMAMQAIAGKPKSTEQTAAEQKQMIRAGVAPRRIVYGQSKVSGPIVYAASSGDNMGVLHLVVPLADHVCQKIETVWLDDYPILESDMDGASVINGKFAGKVLIGKYNGTQTSADGILMAEAPDGWDSTHLLTGITYLTLRLEYDRNVFQGVPNVSANVYGKADLYDPRTGVTGVYSDNWALCVLDYLRGAHGLDCDDDEIDMPFFIAAANLSDEAVQLDAANTIAQSRYTCNGSFTLDQTPINIMEGILAAGGGALVYIAGKYRLHGGAYVAPSANLGPSDFAGPVELQTLPPRAELFNGVKGTFIDPLRFNQASDFPPVVNAAARTADGEDIWRDVQYTFVNDIIRAQRLARMTLYRMRSPLTLRAPLRYASIQLAVWQTVAITLPDFGWTAKPFRITAYSFDPAAGTCTATLTEEQVAAYAWTYDAAIAVPDSPDTTLIDPLVIPAPTGLSLSSSTILQADGTVAAAVNVAWDAVLHAFVDAHEVQWKLTSDSIWNSRDVAMPTISYTIAPVVPGGSYQVRVRGIAGLVRGPYTATGSVAGAADTTPPAVPTGLATAGVLHGISATWNLPADRDLVAVEVYAGTDTTTATRAFVGETLATGYVITGLPTAAGRYIWVRARDRSGNRSAYAGPVFGRASLVLADDLDAAIIDTAKFASGIAPVVLIANLSATAPNNTTALNTADGKLYTRVAGAWVATVQPLGPGGTLTSAQINDLDAAKLLDNSIVAAKLTGGSVTTAKLSVGSANVIWNSTCTRTTDGWVTGSYGSAPAATLGAAIPTGNPSFVLRGLGGGFIRIPTVTVAAGSGAFVDWRPDASFFGVPCLPGDKMQARALLGAHRCAVKLELVWMNASGVEISRVGSAQTTSPAGGLNDSDFAAHTVLAVAPAGTVLALLRLTLVGNGGADPYLFWTKAALGEAPPNATEVGEWEPGGVTDISGGQLRTNSVTAEQINTTSLFADSGVFNDLKAGIGSFGGLTATEIAAGAINATKLASTTLLTQSAQIGSLIVDTFSIGGNAVTSHASALINTPNITGSAAWQRVLNYSITVPFQRDGSSQARDGMIIAQVNNGYSATETHFVAIYLNGGLLTQTGSSQIIDWPVIMTPATLNSGANTIELYWYGASANVFCGTRMMTTLMRAK